MLFPSRDCLGFLPCKRRKNELWKPCLPGERLRFIQSKQKQPLMRFARLDEFGEDGDFGLADLRDELPARPDATVGEGYRCGELWLDFVGCFHRFSFA